MNQLYWYLAILGYFLLILAIGYLYGILIGVIKLKNNYD
jgi:hypothetical protein